MARFLHTSDWQLGMTRHFLAGAAQVRFTDARFQAIRSLGALAREQACEFVVVAGDLFDSNQVERATVSNALDAMGDVPVPIFLLPGNHDALDPASVYRSRTFADRKPDHVQVLTDRAARIVRPGLEVVGAPWTSRQPLEDLVAATCRELEPAAGVVRVLVAHGVVDALNPDRTDPAAIRLAEAERAVRSGAVSYVALGDRHSTTSVGDSGRIWYSGSPETTDYRDASAGNALVVELSSAAVEVTPHTIGRWRFRVLERELAGPADVALLAEELTSLDDKAQTVVKLKLRGTVTLRQWEQLERLLDESRDLFAAIEQPTRHRDVVIVPEGADFEDLELRGFAAKALETLRERARAEGEDAHTARDALALLTRLARKSS